MSGERLEFDIIGRDRASDSFRAAAAAASDLAGKTDIAAKNAYVLDAALRAERKGVDTSARATLSLARADKILADAEHALTDGALEAEFALKKEAEAAKKAGRDSGEAKAGIWAMAKQAASSIGPMGGLAAGLVAMAPVIVTAGAGLGGLGLAAAGIIGPVIKASQSTGGLQKAMATLDPAQRQAAKGFLTLKSDFTGFQNALAPVVLQDFSAALGTVRPILAGLEPVAQSTGKALVGVFDQISAQMHSQEWQQFFAWMAQNAGPDIKMLGDDFTGLMNVLPPVLEILQPLGGALMIVTATIVDTTRSVVDLIQVGGGWVSKLLGMHYNTAAVAHASHDLTAANQGLNTSLRDGAHLMTTSTKWASATGKSYSVAGVNAAAAAAKVQTLADKVTALDAAESKSLSTQLAYANALIGEKNDALSLRKALQASHNEIGLQTVAQRASFSAANTYIGDLIRSASAAQSAHKGIGAQIGAIRQALPLLEQATTKNRAYWQEVRTLKQWLDKLRAERTIYEHINVVTTHTGKQIPLSHIRGYASGTGGAAPGWARVGEHGYELVHFTGGETVLSHGQSAAAAVRGYASGTGAVPIARSGAGGGAPQVELTVKTAPGMSGNLERALLEWLRFEVRTRGGGDVQQALGRR